MQVPHLVKLAQEHFSLTLNPNDNKDVVSTLFLIVSVVSSHLFEGAMFLVKRELHLLGRQSM